MIPKLNYSFYTEEKTLDNLFQTQETHEYNENRILFEHLHQRKYILWYEGKGKISRLLLRFYFLLFFPQVRCSFSLLT